MINIDQLQRKVINIAAFVIPAVITFLVNGHVDSADRVIYAATIGAVFCIPVCNITQGADVEFRKTAPVYEKIRVLLYIFAFPIVYLLLSDYFYDSYPDNQLRNAGTSLLASAIVIQVIYFIIKYVVKLFSKD